MPEAFQCFVQDPAATNPSLSGTLEHKRAVTAVIISLGLQTNLRARAVVLVAADSTVGRSLRDLIQLNEHDPGLKALVEEYMRGEDTGKAMICTGNMQLVQYSPQMCCLYYRHLVCTFTDFCCLLNASCWNAFMVPHLCQHQEVCTSQLSDAFVNVFANLNVFICTAAHVIGRPAALLLKILHFLSLCMHCKPLGLLLVDLTVNTVNTADLCMLLEGTAQIKSSDLDPLDTEHFASASDYSKNDNHPPAKAQLQTTVRHEKQRVGLDMLQHISSCGR